MIEAEEIRDKRGSKDMRAMQDGWIAMTTPQEQYERVSTAG